MSSMDDHADGPQTKGKGKGKAERKSDETYAAPTDKPKPHEAAEQVCEICLDPCAVDPRHNTRASTSAAAQQDGLLVGPAQHRFCKSCLTEYINLKLATSERVFPIACPSHKVR